MSRYLINSLLFASVFCFAIALNAQEPNYKFLDTPGDSYYTFGSESTRYLENERVKLGLDLALGGAVVYLEDKANNSGNMINSYDWGRQIQLSYYSGPRPFIGPNGEQPSPSWAGLGWNPIQSGDCGGYRSRVLKFEQKGDSEIVLVCRPMLWPHVGVPAECLFECRYVLMDNGFSLYATIINNRSDKTQYPLCSQETPALYTNAPWYKLVSYLGDKPFENEPITVIVDKNDGKGWPWRNYYAPENWSALLNEKDYGVGVYQPFSTYASSGFHGGDDAKGKDYGAKDVPTGYIAPRETTILDWNIKRTYRADFIVGSLQEIRETVYRLAQNERQITPNWVFTNDRCNWGYDNATDDGFPIVDSLKINVGAKENAVAKSPETFWKADDAALLQIDILAPKLERVDGTITVRFVPVSPADFVDYLQWSDSANNKEQEKIDLEKKHPRLPDVYVDVPVKFNGERQTLEVDLTKVEGYKGAMKRVEIIFPKTEMKVQLFRVGFAKQS